MTALRLAYVTEIEKGSFEMQVRYEKQMMKAEKRFLAAAFKDISQQGLVEELAPSCPLHNKYFHKIQQRVTYQM